MKTTTRLIAILLVGCILVSVGCTGPFNLTKRVHKWQTSFENRWSDEAAFLGCVILPVYGLASLGDAIIFNTIEFWGGENPIEAARVEGDGKTVDMALQEDGSIHISDGQQTFTFVRTDAGVTAKDADGNVVYRSVKDETNVVSVYDASGELVRRSAS
jgi:uncharacterized protein DUF3332